MFSMTLWVGIISWFERDYSVLSVTCSVSNQGRPYMILCTIFTRDNILFHITLRLIIIIRIFLNMSRIFK